MEKDSLYEMFKTMINNAYNKKSIEDLKAINRAIELIPMKYIMSGAITIMETNKMQEDIDNKINELILASEN